MAFINIPGLWLPKPNINTGTAVIFSGRTINASGDRIGFVIRAPKSGTLDWFEVLLGAVSNQPDNGLRFSFQTVDAATGNPDLTQAQYVDLAQPFSANSWLAPSQVMTHDGTSGGTKRTVTKGEPLACVIDFVSFVASDSITINCNLANSDREVGWAEYLADASTGTFAKLADSMILALKYSDGTYGVLRWPNVPASDLTATTFNSGSTPDERALRFQLPAPMRCSGFWMMLDLDNDADIVLYDASSNVLATRTLDKDLRTNTNQGTFQIDWDTPVELSPFTTYRLSCKPGASSVTAYQFSVPSAAHLAAMPGGAEWYLSTRTDAGAWSDSTTARPWAGLGFDGISNIASSGSSGVSYGFVG